MATLFYHAQTNVQLQISSAKPYCELAAKHPFFETSQSCVSTKAFLSHRFKSSPAIPGKVAVPGVAGYMMTAGHFSENLESSGDLNRPRSPEVRKPLVYFWYFSYTRKVRKTFLSQEVPRFRKPQTSTPQPQLRAATIKTFLREIRGFANLESAHKGNNFAQTKLKPFETFRFAESLSLPGRHTPCAFLPPLAAISLLLTQQSLAAKPP